MPNTPNQQNVQKAPVTIEQLHLASIPSAEKEVLNTVKNRGWAYQREVVETAVAGAKSGIALVCNDLSDPILQSVSHDQLKSFIRTARDDINTVAGFMPAGVADVNVDHLMCSAAGVNLPKAQTVTVAKR